MRLSQQVRRIAMAVEEKVVIKNSGRWVDKWYDTWSTRKDLSKRYFKIVRNTELEVYDRNTTEPKTVIKLYSGDLFWAKNEGQENTPDSDKVTIVVAKSKDNKFEYDPKQELLVRIDEVYEILDNREVKEITEEYWTTGGKSGETTEPGVVTDEDIFKEGSPAKEALKGLTNPEKAKGMGYKDNITRKVIREILLSQPEITTEEIIRLALPKLKGT